MYRVATLSGAITFYRSDNNNNQAHVSYATMKSDVLTFIPGKSRSTRSSKSDRTRSDLQPDSIDSLADAARDVLMDKYLEVSKVRPFFWSMVEIYADRFQTYPFDAFKALYGYLELNDFPEEEMADIIRKLELAYIKKHGKPVKRSTEVISAHETLDDEIRDLKDSLCYASLLDTEPE